MAGLLTDEQVAAKEAPGLLSDEQVAAKPTPAAQWNVAERAAALAAEGTPEWQRRAAAVGRSMSEPVEALQQIVAHITGKGAQSDKEAQDRALAMEALYAESSTAKTLKTATDITSGFLLPGVKGAGLVGKLGAGVLTGTGYSALEPVTSGGDFTSEKAKQLTGGALTGGALGGLSAISRPSRILNAIKGKTPPATKEVGTGAQKVLDELQRIRFVMDKELPPSEAGSSYERLRLMLDEATTPLRERAFATNAIVDMNPALSLIESLKWKTTNPNVLKSLDDAKSIIKDGVSKSVGTSAPTGGRISTAQLRVMQGAESGKQRIDLVDESRQAINDLISGKGDKPHGPFAQKQLIEVQKAMLENTPPAYKTYLSEYAKNAAALDKYSLAGNSPLNKLTSGFTAAQRLTGRDAQNVLEGVFKSKTAGRDLKHIVDLTSHDPSAADGLRQSYRDWLTQIDPKTNVAQPGTLLDRWEKTRDAVASSGLFTPDHVMLMNGVMDDMRKSLAAAGAKRLATTVGGFFAGGMVGRPFAGSHFAGQFATQASTAAVREQIERAVIQMSLDPAGARLLAQKPTTENVAAAKKWAMQYHPSLLKTLEIYGGRESGEQQPASRSRQNDAQSILGTTLQ